MDALYQTPHEVAAAKVGVPLLAVAIPGNVVDHGDSQAEDNSEEVAGDFHKATRNDDGVVDQPRGGKEGVAVHADDAQRNGFYHKVAHDSKVSHTEKTSMAKDDGMESEADSDGLLHTVEVDHHPKSWASLANFWHDEADGDAEGAESVATADIFHNGEADSGQKNHPGALLRISHAVQPWPAHL